MRVPDSQNRVEFATLYAQFRSPITELDCGKKCAPYNENGVPFCCDTDHTVPTAYLEEWHYLENATDLWHIWRAEDDQETERMISMTPEGQTLIACLGHDHCQRDFRSITCRAFPFFPYISEEGQFMGLSYYHDYRDRCWVVSNLETVTQEYRQEFITAYELIFEHMPGEIENFRYHAQVVREIHTKSRRTIPLLHRNGENYRVSPTTEKLLPLNEGIFPKFGQYKIAARLPFPDEL